MTNADAPVRQRRGVWPTPPDKLHPHPSRYAVAALERHKREGLELASRRGGSPLG